MTIFLLLVIIVLLCLVLYWLWHCRPTKKGVPARQPDTPSAARLPDYERNHDLILMVKPGFTMPEVLAFIQTNYPQLQQQAKVVPYCLSCDNMLFSVEGFNPAVFGQTVPSPHDPMPMPPVRPNGDELPFFYTPNYKMRLPENDSNSIPVNTAIPLTATGKEAGEPVLVAILDTGLRREIATAYQPDIASHCRGVLGLHGYNVLADSSNTTDDYTGNGQELVEHGTPVAGLVLRYANRYPVNVKILPVKVLNEKGYGTLLQLMCGLAYAKNAGARIINTSLGFYAAEPEQVVFFKEFIDRLTADNTLIIAAAGNEEATEDLLATKEIGVANLRNLDKHLFYPAAFSVHNENIIAATTVFGAPNRSGAVSTLQVSPRQNYSPLKVQIGVQADVQVPLTIGQAKTDFVFLNPYGPEQQNAASYSPGWKMWSGSSFAAPVLTGLVAATYYQYLNEQAGEYHRTNYLNWLVTNKYLIRKTELLETETNETDKVPALLLLRPDELCYVDLANERAGKAG